MAEIVVIAHNIRSTHNVGSIFRTCDGFGVKRLILGGYTPFPETTNDPRLPHERKKIAKDIHKTALGAELTVPFEVYPFPPIAKLKEQGYKIVALEQDKNSKPLPSYVTPPKIALIIGEEVNGIPKDLLIDCDEIVEIPMTGQKESFNVSVATGVALYHLSLIG